MREIQISPLFTARKRRSLGFCGLALLIMIIGGGSGCTVKKKVETSVSPKFAAAKNATLEDLINLLGKYEKITDLKCGGLKIFLTTGKWESGSQEEYRGAPGYILLRRPNSVHLVLQSPVLMKTALFDMVSSGDSFSAWLRSKNRVYVGRNSARELVAEDMPGGIPIRPSHIFEALLPSDIVKDDEHRVSVEESADKNAKYYILSVYREGIHPRIHTIRRIWVERSQMTISRQQMFEPDGRMICDIEYDEMEPVGEFIFPNRINMTRPEDGYSLKIEINKNSWKINSGVEDDAFILAPREGAETVYLKDHH